METYSDTDGDFQEQADLFSLSGDGGASQNGVTPESAPQPEQTPETLPMIPGGAPQIFDRIESERPPLIFTERAPIPTRNGKQEETGSSYQRHHEQIEPPKKFKPLSPDQVPEDATLGMLLKLARMNSGYDLEYVKTTTRIGLDYLEALEGDTPDRFPPQVYAFAYTRTLCSLYHLPEELREKAIELLNSCFHDDVDVSLKILENLSRESVVNREEERRVGRLFTVAAITIGVICLLGVWVVVALMTGDDVPENDVPRERPAEQPSAISEAELPVKQTVTSAFDPKQLESLNAIPICNLYTLELGRTPNVIRK